MSLRFDFHVKAKTKFGNILPRLLTHGHISLFLTSGSLGWVSPIDSDPTFHHPRWRTKKVAQAGWVDGLSEKEVDDSARSHTILRHHLQVLPVSLSLYFSSLFLFSEGLIYAIFFFSRYAFNEYLSPWRSKVRSLSLGFRLFMNWEI